MPHFHTLEPERRTLHGHFSRDLKPVLNIQSGDTVHYRTLESGWRVQPHPGGDYVELRRFLQRESPLDDGHALIGPVAIEGAQPGKTLQIDVKAVEPDSWGGCITGGQPSATNLRYGTADKGIVQAWTLDSQTMNGRNHLGHTVALRPFMGVMGMPPDEPGIHSTIPPRLCGGNLDCKELVAGSTLYLPISVPGALFSVGDGHAVQGDGEVGGTAIECAMARLELPFTVRDDFPITVPTAHTPAGWLTMGLGANLDDATFMALEAMFALLGRFHHVSRLDAIALASVAVDLRITQIVNQVVGVHALLPPGAIR